MPKFSVLQRRLHRWGSILISLPLLLVVATGILLQLKKDVEWIQPRENKGRSGEMAATFDRILQALQAVPEAGVATWADVNRLDVRPDKGMIKVWCRNNWEVQVDTSTAAVLQVAYRRSDLIESLHDGSWFHDAVKRWVFLPAAVILLGLWLTGIYLFILPHWVRLRRAA